MLKNVFTIKTLIAITLAIATPVMAVEKVKEKPDFEAIDLDRDGNISFDESKKHQWLSDNFATLDADKDGLITKQEFALITQK